MWYVLKFACIKQVRFCLCCIYDRCYLLLFYWYKTGFTQYKLPSVSSAWHVIKPTITLYTSSTDNNRYGRFNTHEKRGKRAGHMEFEIKILFPHVSPCAKFAYQKVTIKMSIKFQKYEAVWRQIKEIAYFIMKKLNVIYFILFPCGKCK